MLRHFHDPVKNYDHSVKVGRSNPYINRINAGMEPKNEILLRQTYDFIWNWLGFYEALDHPHYISKV